MASESVARRGVAPIAARSLKLTASARWPIAAAWNEPPVEVDAFHGGVGRDDLQLVALRARHRPIVARAHEEPVGSEGEAARDPIDQVMLAEIGNGDGRRS